MSSPRSLVSAFALSLLAAACSNAAKESAQPGTKDSGTSQVWTRLIEGSWTLGPGEEKTRFCIKKELTEDVYIKAIRPVHPKGTHHTLLTLGDGKIDCTTAVVQGLVYAAGVGSEGLEMPEGVALKLPKGKFLNLGLHLYNTGDTEIAGTSAMEVVTMPASEVKYESEALLAGPVSLSLPPGKETLVHNECTLGADQNMFALFPHMHQYGKHLKTTFTMGGQEKVIHDGDYTFDEQVQLPLAPVAALHAGDKITTDCTFQNTSAKTVTFGESSDTEMCFSILFRYPALGNGGFCSSGSGGGRGDAGAKPALPGPACAAKGAAGNDVGVGKECATSTDCVDNHAASVCLADYTTGEFGNFCTFLCQGDADCGAAAKCRGQTGRAVCIPDACIASDAGATAP
jgi:hypothetical protein